MGDTPLAHMANTSSKQPQWELK